MKKICFRFDVDTYLCASKGVPNLIELAKKNNAHFIFFYNMGKAIHLLSLLKKKQQYKPCAKKLSNYHKLGWHGYLTTALFNPLVGASYPNTIVTALRNGHEIGLHGGTNHGDWMKNAQSWDLDRINKEIEWGLGKLHKIGVKNVTSFSSPGWCAPQELNNILCQKGFKVVADNHGHNMEKILTIRYNNHTLNQVPTNLLGEPGGVGYIEHMRARQMCSKDILEKFKTDLAKINQLAVIYDHPYYTGIKEIELLGNMICVARSMGFQTTTFDKLT